jgi:hypothetical protein
MDELRFRYLIRSKLRASPQNPVTVDAKFLADARRLEPFKVQTERTSDGGTLSIATGDRPIRAPGHLQRPRITAERS